MGINYEIWDLGKNKLKEFSARTDNIAKELFREYAKKHLSLHLSLVSEYGRLICGYELGNYFHKSEDYEVK